jgi:flagellar basal-body rod protein FlgF
MDNTTFVGLSRQMTLRRELDIVANNIANADTAGFKVESLLNAAEERRPARDLGIDHPVRFTLDNGVARDFSQGAVKPTGNPLDVALDGDGFLTVETAAGPRYTRDGRLGMNEVGQLVTKAGDPVLDAGGSPIVLRPQGGAVHIAANGTVTQDDAVVGKIGVVRFDNLSALSKEGNGRYLADGVEPVAAPDVQLRQGMVEGSNAQPVLEVVKLIELSRAYERMSKMMDNSQDLSRRAVERLGRGQ